MDELQIGIHSGIQDLLDEERRLERLKSLYVVRLDESLKCLNAAIEAGAEQHADELVSIADRYGRELEQLETKLTYLDDAIQYLDNQQRQLTELTAETYIGIDYTSAEADNHGRL